MPKSSFLALPPEFNSCNRPRAGTRFSIFHMCGDEKTFLMPLCEWENVKSARCRDPEVRALQRLLVRANPCNRAGRSVSACNAAGAGRAATSRVRPC